MRPLFQTGFSLVSWPGSPHFMTPGRPDSPDDPTADGAQVEERFGMRSALCAELHWTRLGTEESRTQALARNPHALWIAFSEPGIPKEAIPEEVRRDPFFSIPQRIIEAIEELHESGKESVLEIEERVSRADTYVIKISGKRGRVKGSVSCSIETRSPGEDGSLGGGLFNKRLQRLSQLLQYFIQAYRAYSDRIMDKPTCK